MSFARGLLLLGLLSACASKHTSSSPTPPAFDKHPLDPAYRSEGASVFDVDRDGHLDIVTDQYWYKGPDFSPNEIRAPESFDPTTSFCNSFAIYPHDVDGDGWTDILVAPHFAQTMSWYQNPGRAGGHWPVHVMVGPGVVGLEAPLFFDLFADHRPVMLSTDVTDEVLGWYDPAADVTQPWTFHAISKPRFPGAGVAVHGIGVGDVDGDGKLDVLTAFAWFQQTDDPARWIEHDFAFSDVQCSRMYTYDFDGDGLADVLCGHPHDYGLRWWKQAPVEPGAERTFVEQHIDDTFSELHALRFDDLDGDGVPEIVTGKRWLAHVASQGLDPGANDPAVLAYFVLHRTGRAVSFERHDIDEDSGVGGQFEITDVDGDGKVDIVTSNKKGLYLFRQR